MLMIFETATLKQPSSAVARLWLGWVHTRPVGRSAHGHPSLFLAAQLWSLLPQ